MQTLAPSNSPALQEAAATPLGSPDPSSPRHFRLNNVQQFTEMVDDIVTRKIASTMEELEQRKDPKSMDSRDVQLGDVTAEASSIEFKTVDEV
jgi:hypothetical protein